MKTPMLATDVRDLSSLRFPLIAQPKYDGIRACLYPDNLYGRSGKPIPNVLVREKAMEVRRKHRPKIPDDLVLDGELIVLKGNTFAPFNEVDSVIMSRYALPTKTRFIVFDCFSESRPGLSQTERLKILQSLQISNDDSFFLQAATYKVTSAQEVLMLYRKFINRRYEGIILRSMTQTYKHGRSTMLSQHLLRIKPTHTATATIIDVEQLHRNNNPPEITPTGYTKRSSQKANKEPMPMLGALLCVADNGALFRIGTGFTEEQRYALWKAKGDLKGKKVRYKYISRVSSIPHSAVFVELLDCLQAGPVRA